MDNPYRTSPMMGGLLICLGGVLMVLCGYFYFDDVAEKPGEARTLFGLAGTGYVLWVAGSMQLARARFSSIQAGLLCGLLLVPGLIALLTMVRTRSRQQIWQEANPGLSRRAQQRQYRNVKSLY